MTFTTDLARAANRIQANLPQASVGGTSIFYKLISAFQSSKADTDYKIAASSVNMFLASASGTPLAVKVNDYGVNPSGGTASAVAVLFSVQLVATAPLTIGSGTAVSTAGDGITTIAQVFTTQAPVTIAAGQFTAGAGITAVTNTSGTSIGTAIAAGTLTISSNPANLGITAFTLWTVTATATGGAGVGFYSVFKNGVLVGAAGAYTPGTTYDGATAIIPGVSLLLTGTITSGNSATFSTTYTTASALCTTTGTAGNVLAGTVTVLVTAIGGPAVYNVTNPAAATGGTNADTDPVIRNKGLAALLPKFSVAGVQAAAIAAGAFDCYVANGAGTATVYWCDVNGLQAIAAGGTTATLTAVNAGWPTPNPVLSISGTPSGAGYSTSQPPIAFFTGGAGTGASVALLVSTAGVVTGYTNLIGGASYTSAPTITVTGPGVPTAVTYAILGALPGGVTVTISILSVISVATLTITYTAPIALQSGALDANIKAAAVAYIQTMVHGQTPNSFAMAQYVSGNVAGTIYNFVCSTSFSTATNTQIYRATACTVGTTPTWV